MPLGRLMQEGGLIKLLNMGIEYRIYPPLIFLGIGASTDFASLIANPKSLLLGAAAQFGIFRLPRCASIRLCDPGSGIHP